MPWRRVVPLRFALLALAVASAPMAAAEQPAKIFATSCAPCHGKSGKPTSVFARQGVRDFSDPAWQKETNDAQIEKAIREGKQGTMMVSYASRLSPEEVKGLAAYIRKLGPRK